MCRFAIVKTSQPTLPREFLDRFANMAQASRAPDGDIQGDGWGVSWRENDTWKRHAEVTPIWESRNTFCVIPKTNHFLVHARSASFARDKDNIGYNQPYISDNLAFVFNGLLKGVKFPRPLAGKIGAEKIWSLLQELSGKNELSSAFEMLTKELNQYTREIQALNIGVSDGQRFYFYCQFSSNREYYTLHVHKSSELTIVSSEPLEGYAFSRLEQFERVYRFE